MKIRIISTFLVMSFLFMGTSSCGNSKSEAEENTTNSMIDPSGNKIDVPVNIRGIVSLAPSCTETLVELGLGDKIIGADQNSSNIKGIKNGLPMFDMMNPDSEKLMSLSPDIIFESGISVGGGEDPLKIIKDSNICVVYIPTENSLEEIENNTLFIGKATGTYKKASEIVKNMKSEITKIQDIGKTITDKKKIYFEIASEPDMYSFGNGVFLNEMIDIIGAENIFRDQKSWISVSEEDVINKNPDVIFTSVNYEVDPDKKIKDRSGWNVISAVKNDQVYLIDTNESIIPDFNVVKALVDMAKKVYPDKYDDIK